MKVLIDTNVIISAILFGGNPREILNQVITKDLEAVTSQVLLAELSDVLHKKFKYSVVMIRAVIKQLNKELIIVNADQTVKIARDQADNRVLEAALVGGCEYIITGDKDLLDLSEWKNIRIITPGEFMRLK